MFQLARCYKGLRWVLRGVLQNRKQKGLMIIFKGLTKVLEGVMRVIEL